jgi:uncharacterized protein YciI
MNFFCKLNPPRPDFAQTMTEAEASLMQQHAAYWTEWLAKGHVVAFGLVADPAGAFGVGIVDFPSEAEARSFTDADPTIQSGAGFRFDVYLMPMGVTTRS